MTHSGQAKCLVMGPASTPGSAFDPGNGVFPLLTTVQFLQVQDQNCAFNKA